MSGESLRAAEATRPHRAPRSGKVVLLSLLVAFGGLLASGPAATTSARTSHPCGAATKPRAVYSHVVMVVLENHSFSQIAHSSPYLNHLARQCGLADRYFAVTRPSLPNYLALTSGSTNGISSDCTSCQTSARSIFEQLRGDWRSYQESMPTPGYRGAAYGKYVMKHNPAAYFSRIAAAYATNAVPLESPAAGLLHDLRQNRLRRFSLVVPNLCHDEHDCSIATGDRWLRQWLPRILASRAYRHGGTALFITYDEGTASDNRVYTVVVSPSTPAGTLNSAQLNHYSLLRTVESMLGLRCLAHACDRATRSMRAAFRL